MKLIQSTITVAAIAATALGATAAEKKECKACPDFGDKLLKPASKIVLPDEFNSPDGMTIGTGRFLIDETVVGSWPLPPSPLGLVVDTSDLVFHDVTWKD